MYLISPTGSRFVFVQATDKKANNHNNDESPAEH